MYSAIKDWTKMPAKSCICFALCLLIILAAPWQSSFANTLTSISVNGDDERTGFFPAYSEDGQFAVFSVYGPGFVPEHTFNGQAIYLNHIATGEIELISKNDAGLAVHGDRADISADGRYIVFVSVADDIAGAPLAFRDNTTQVYWMDRLTSETRLISKNAVGDIGSGASNNPSISEDGQTVLFVSNSNNLRPASSIQSEGSDIYIYNVGSDSVSSISFAEDGSRLFDCPACFGETGPQLSGNGRIVAFITHNSLLAADDNGLADIYLWDLQTSTFEFLGQSGTGENFDDVVFFQYGFSISTDGRFVTAVTNASLLSDDPVNGNPDVYLFDRNTKDIVLVSKDEIEGFGPLAIDAIRNSVSADGSHVAFVSESSPFPGVYNGLFLYDVNEDVVTLENATNISADVFVGESGDFIYFSKLEDEIYAIALLFRADRGAKCTVPESYSLKAIPPLTWLQLSLPCVPPGGAAGIEDIFGDDIAGAYGVDWAVYTFDANSSPPQYNFEAANAELTAGQGFYLIHAGADVVELDLPLQSRAKPRDVKVADACVSDNLGCNTIPLTGTLPSNATIVWNMLGNTVAGEFGTQLSKARITTEAGTCSNVAGCTLLESANEEITAPTLWHWNGSAYDSLSSGDNLLPWQGFWMGELSGAVSNRPTLFLAQ